MCSCNTSTYKIFIWIDHKRLCKKKKNNPLDSVNMGLSDSCTGVGFKAAWGEIAWVSLIYLWNETVPRHDALSVVLGFLMDLWDGKHGNLSQVWELFFCLIKLVSRRFLWAIDPSNGSAAPCCAITNIYSVHCIQKKTVLVFYFEISVVF